ncbi:hypothetical protein BB8028_0002g14620 [Beauveria bassiana]|uniref:Uncharacterized protein n=1 Tax=Beauveria bassiana TaxID=176275 RepID=A0A2S7Y522_BEABA|nr:hypothetical protein BB8028_0002g14620 [Beauveria bassiana]
MAGKPQYSDAEILWFVKQVFEYKIKNEDLVCQGFKERFGRELKSHQHKYLKGRYGRDPAFNCPAITGIAFLVKPAISEEAQLPIVPLVQNLTVMACPTMELHGNVDQCLNSIQPMEGDGNVGQSLGSCQPMEGYGNVGQTLNASQSMEGYGNVGQSINSSQPVNGYGNVGQSINSSQPVDGYGNVGQGFNGGSSGMAMANHYTTARHPTASNNPRQTTESPVPVPRRADLSGMYTASRVHRSERRHRAARAAAYQQAQAAVHADEQVERQLQNRQQVHGTRQNIERLQMPGIPQPQYPANQTPMLWPQANVSPSTQQEHFSHGMHQAQGVTHQETFASEQLHWTMNSHSAHQPPAAVSPQQATYMSNHSQELLTQRWIETQANYQQGRQSAAPAAYMGNHGQELGTGPWNGTQGPHLQEIQYSAPAAPEDVFSAPQQGSWEVAPQLGAPDLATFRATEENQQEPVQGMQNPHERNAEPQPSAALSRGQLQQSEPLSQESQAANRNLQGQTSARQPSPFSYQVISIQHLQQLLAGTSNGTENAKEQDGEVDDFNIADFINLENAP